MHSLLILGVAINSQIWELMFNPFFDCAKHVRHMFETRSAHARNMFDTCSKLVRHMFETCSTHVRNMFDTCSKLVRHMFETCSTHVSRRSNAHMQ